MRKCCLVLARTLFPTSDFRVNTAAFGRYDRSRDRSIESIGSVGSVLGSPRNFGKTRFGRFATFDFLTSKKFSDFFSQFFTVFRDFRPILPIFDFSTSTSASTSNFASDTPFLRSVRPKIGVFGRYDRSRVARSRRSVQSVRHVRLVRRSSGSSGSSPGTSKKTLGASRPKI